MIRIVAFLLLASAFCGAQTLKIVVAGQNAETIADWQTASDKVKLVQVTSDTAMSEIADADAYIGNIRPELVEAGKKLRWVQTFSAGVEQVLHKSGSDALADSDIVLTNNQIVQGPEIADHAMAFLLTLTRFLPTYLKRQADENWQARPYELFELNGKNALVIGMGGIGLQIAIRAWAHGMSFRLGCQPEIARILGFRRDWAGSARECAGARRHAGSRSGWQPARQPATVSCWEVGFAPLAPCGRLPPGFSEAFGNSDGLPGGLRRPAAGAVRPPQGRSSAATPVSLAGCFPAEPASVSGRSQSMAGARRRRRAAPTVADSGTVMRRPRWRALPAATPDSGAAERSAE